jgi:hypothetical protein
VTWREQDHPRDGRGRFAEKAGGGWARQVSAQLGGADGFYRPAGDASDRLDYERLHQLPVGGGLGYHPDQILGAIYEEQGFHGPPEVVTRAELERRVTEDGWILLYRGIGSGGAGFSTTNADRARLMRERAEQFRGAGEHYPGTGVRGSGTYTTDSPDDAQQYTEPDEDHEWGPDRWPGLLRMALRPDARIVDWEEIDGAWQSLVERLQSSGLSPERYEAAFGVLADEGRRAAALGYDAIRLRRGSRYMILNRTALAVQKGGAG